VTRLQNGPSTAGSAQWMTTDEIRDMPEG
jgi:hypothetical protein